MNEQYKEFELEKQQFSEMNSRMDSEKQKVVAEREKIESEIKGIKALNEELYRQNNMNDSVDNHKYWSH